MGNITIATMFIVFANILMFLSQAAMLDINPNGTFCYDASSSPISYHLERNNQDAGNVINNLYTQPTVKDDADNQQNTDLFSRIISSLKSVPGLGFIIKIVAAPYNILDCMGLPSAFILAVGTAWYSITLLVVISFIWWRD